MTSYSYRNRLIDVSAKSDSSHVEQHTQSASGSAKSVGNKLLWMMGARAPSKPVISGDHTESNDTSFTAFKVLPVGSTHVPNESRYTEGADDLASATSCKEAVDLIVDAIKRACEDIGSAEGDGFISEGDIVRWVGPCGHRAPYLIPASVCQKHSVRRASMQRWSTA